MAMHKGRREHHWNLTANLMALIANRHRGTKERVYRAADFLPVPGKQSRGGIPVTADNIHVLKVFLPKS